MENETYDETITIEELKTAFPSINSINLFIVELIVNKRIESNELERLESVEKWINQCFNKPKDIEIQMFVLNELLEGFGVESMTMEEVHLDSYWGSTIGLYVNTGDTYSATIVYDNWNDLFLLTTWGDYWEGAENNKDNFS